MKINAEISQTLWIMRVSTTIYSISLRDESICMTDVSSRWNCTCYAYRNLVFVILITHWGRVTHICVGNPTIIGSDNGLSPGRRQAIIWTNAGILLFGPLGTNFSDFFCRNYSIFIKKNAFESVVCEMAAFLSRPQCDKQNSITNVLWWSHCVE